MRAALTKKRHPKAPALLHQMELRAVPTKSQDFTHLFLLLSTKLSWHQVCSSQNLFPHPFHTTKWHFDNAGIFSMRQPTNYQIFSQIVISLVPHLLCLRKVLVWWCHGTLTTSYLGAKSFTKSTTHSAHTPYHYHLYICIKILTCDFNKISAAFTIYFVNNLTNSHFKQKTHPKQKNSAPSSPF